MNAINLHPDDQLVVDQLTAMLVAARRHGATCAILTRSALVAGVALRTYLYEEDGSQPSSETVARAVLAAHAEAVQA